MDEKHVEDIDTDKRPIVKPRAVSYDMCARINALINPRWSSIRIYIKTEDTQYYALVKSIVPAVDPGFVIVDCDTIFGKMLLHVGAGHSFDLRLQI